MYVKIIIDGIFKTQTDISLSAFMGEVDMYPHFTL